MQSEDGEFKPRRAGKAEKKGQILFLPNMNPVHVAGQDEKFAGRDGRNRIEKNMRQFDESKPKKTHRWKE